MPALSSAAYSRRADDFAARLRGLAFDLIELAALAVFLAAVAMAATAAGA